MSAGEPSKSLKSEFVVADEIKAILAPLGKVEQQRVLRWVGESLGLAEMPALGAGQGPVTATTQPQTSLSQVGHTAPASSPAVRAKDLKTFVQEKSPRSDVHFAAVTAYYYRFEAQESNKKEMITASDLDNATRLAGRSRFTKPYVPLQNAVTQGYLDRTAERGAFKINAVGENLVAMSLPGGAGERNGSGWASKKDNRRKVKVAAKKAKAS